MYFDLMFLKPKFSKQMASHNMESLQERNVWTVRTKISENIVKNQIF